MGGIHKPLGGILFTVSWKTLCSLYTLLNVLYDMKSCGTLYIATD